jgi:hypothetical protein
VLDPTRFEKRRRTGPYCPSRSETV